MWIKEYRKKYGLSREELGRLAKCSGALIYILEQGGITHPGIADRIASICNVGRNERNSIVDGAHWRAGWKATPRYRNKGEKAEKAYFLRQARERREAEERQSLSQPDGCQLPLHKGARGQEPGQPTRREAAGRLAGAIPQDMPRVAATAEPGQPTRREAAGRLAGAIPQDMPRVAATRPEGVEQPTEVYAVNRLGEVVGRYPDCAAAARQYAVKPYTVESRCEHRIGKHTNEFFLSGVTFRYASEWDGLNRDAQQSMVREAESSVINKQRREPVAEGYSWQGQTHSVAEWARIAGMSRQTLRSRLAGGWDIEKALKTPVQNREK